mmetsp:Transcript_51859/g.162575  ORF Transcript_51859/g.162575 Transcript_51859/m.162575 type:complete len:397 (+) Transcript_51859:176-1366(+)
MLQKLPAEALVPPCDAAAMMLETRGSREDPPRVLALSYRWLTKEHPDPDGVQLGKVLGFLDEMVLAVFRSREEAATRAELDIGILWDYMSLPQHPRSATEQDLFLRGLKAINRLYGSTERTLTLQLIDDPDGSHPYHKSGWCRFEEAVAGIGKGGSLLLAVEEKPAPCIDGPPLPPPTVKYLEPHPGTEVLQAHGLDSLAQELRRQNAKESPMQAWRSLCSDMSSSRSPPLHPNDMAKLLRSDEVTFTNRSDVDMVIAKYRDFFRKVADTVVRLDYRHRLLASSEKTKRCGKVTWSPEQFRLLGNALGEDGLRSCKYLYLGGVNLREADARVLAEALVKATSLEEVQLPMEIADREGAGYATFFQDQSVEPAALRLLYKRLGESGVHYFFCDAEHV